MRIAPLFLALTLSTGCSLAASPVPIHSLPDDAATLDTPFNVHSETRIPGKVLKPGGYTITIKDHLSDRAIVQVTSDKGKLESTFLTRCAALPFQVAAPLNLFIPRQRPRPLPPAARNRCSRSILNPTT